MYERILVAFDGSEHAELALAHAIKLARLAGAKLKIITVIENVLSRVNSAEFNVSAVKAEIILRARALLDAARTKAHDSRIEAHAELIFEDAEAPGISRYIEHAAEAFEADLIVIGAFGLRGIRHDVIGSVALATMRTAAKNIIVVR
jgi:nucleotide-binding universal stress UspA family protein